MNQELKKIKQLYLDGKLFEDTDEKGAGGYWDLAGDIVAELSENGIEYQNNLDLYEQLQTGIYGVFQKILVRGEKYE